MRLQLWTSGDAQAGLHLDVSDTSSRVRVREPGQDWRLVLERSR